MSQERDVIITDSRPHVFAVIVGVVAGPPG